MYTCGDQGKSWVTKNTYENYSFVCLCNNASNNVTIIFPWNDHNLQVLYTLMFDSVLRFLESGLVYVHCSLLQIIEQFQTSARIVITALQLLSTATQDYYYVTCSRKSNC